MGRLGFPDFNTRNKSRPENSGILTSDPTISGSYLSTAAFASTPLAAKCVSYPQRPNITPKTSRIAGSSSTTNTVDLRMVSLQCSNRLDKDYLARAARHDGRWRFAPQGAHAFGEKQQLSTQETNCLPSRKRRDLTVRES